MYSMSSLSFQLQKNLLNKDSCWKFCKNHHTISIVNLGLSGVAILPHSFTYALHKCVQFLTTVC